MSPEPLVLHVATHQLHSACPFLVLRFYLTVKGIHAYKERGLFLLRGLELKQRPFSIHILEVATRNRVIDVSALEFSLPVERDPAVHILSVP